MRNVFAAFLAAVIGLVFANPASGASEVGAIVVKYRDDAPAAETSAQISLAAQSRIAQALQSGFVPAGRTNDGAYRFELHPALSPDAARAALNRIRLDSAVLYANQDRRSTAASPETVRASAKSLSAVPATDQIIVKYRDPALIERVRAGVPLSPAELDAIGDAIGQPAGFLRVTGGDEFVLSLFRFVTAPRATLIADLLAQRPDIEYAEPDTRMSYLLTPNDPLYPYQWDFFDPVAGVNMPAAWNLTTGSPSIYVGIIDTGILPHPDLVGRFVGGYDFIASTLISNDGDGRDADATDPGDWVTQADIDNGLGDCDPASSSWHGTHVAGTVGATANNTYGVAGINWVSKIVPLRVLGKCLGYTSDIADAIRWGAGLAVTNVPTNPYPARVLNLSLGGGGACGATFQNAINAALAAPGGGAVIAIAAGNSNANAANESPGNCNGVITVAALDSSGARASYSNYGATVEIAAPGTAILSTRNNGTSTANIDGYNFEYRSGTSMAAPHVAGIASLMLSRNPGLTPAQVLAKIQTTARPFLSNTGNDCTTSICGAGMIDASAAVAASLPSGATATSIATSGSPSTLGASVAFTATVSGSNPTGTVNFTDGGTTITGCATQGLSGTGDSRAATCSTTALAVGTHTIAASYSGDGSNAASTSSGLSQVVNPVGSGSNVALASAGAVASASSSYSAAYPPAALNNGDRAGLNPGNGGYWNDATPSVLPDSVQILFSGSKTIDRVVVYSVQDNYTSPVDPGDTLTFSLYGVTAFTVEGWNGTAWEVLGTVSGNNLVKRTVAFAAYTTDRIRVTITGTVDHWTRVTEIEAFGAAAGPSRSISGTLLSGSTPIPGATVAVSSGGSCTPSDADGHYTCAVAQAWTGQVMPTHASYTFTPPWRSYLEISGDQTAQDYAARTAVAAAPWSNLGRDAQHSAKSTTASQPINRVHWQAAMDLQPQYTGSSLLIHYGSPLVTSANTVIVPVKTGASGGFRVEARQGSDGMLKWSMDSDYILPPHGWVLSFGPAVTPQPKLYFAGAGGTVHFRDQPDATQGASSRLAFYGLANYQSSPQAYDAAVMINTPLTTDSAGNVYFGFQVTGSTPLGLTSGIARIDGNGQGTWTSVANAAADATMTKVPHNSAPALSPNGNTLYVAVSNGSTGYLVALNSTTLAPIARVRLRDPNSGADGTMFDNGSSSPTVGPDGDVYFGVIENPFPSNNDRGWMLHFDSSLAQIKTPGAFGWDITPSIVPASMVPSYAGGSSYLLMTKYNNYAGRGGDGQNKIAVLDPNATQIDSITGATVMKEVLTVVGPTPDGDFGVKEWCINTAAVDPLTKSVLANSEDGKVYRWDLTTNTLSQAVVLTSGLGEAYTSTVIGADGHVYAINNATLFAVGI